MRRASPVALLSAFAAVAGTGVACSGDGATAPAPVPALVQIVQGSPQSRRVGMASDTLVIRVLDGAGTPIPGQTVAWTTSAGTLGSGSTVTAADGSSGNRLLSIGTTAGTVTVSAQAGTATGSMTVTATAEEPAALVGVAALPATLAAGTADSIRVRASDQYGNPVAGVEVSFQVTEGTGSITGSPATTNGQGVASARFLTGNVVGPNSASATSAAVAGATVVFSVTTVPGPAASLAKIGDLTPGMVAGSADSLRVRVTDIHGNLRPGAAVSFQVAAGGGVLQGIPAITDSEGIAAVRLVTGPLVGTNLVTASLPGVAGATVEYSVVTVAGPAAQLLKVGGDPTDRLAGASDSVRVRVADANGNGVAGLPVTFEVTAGGGTVSPASGASSADGLVAALWSRGTGVAANALRASSAGVGAPVDFMLQTVVPAAISFATQLAYLVQGATATPAVTVRDNEGSVLPTPSLAFVSRAPSIASVGATGVITAASPGQALVVASAPVPAGGSVSDSLLVAIIPPAGILLHTSLVRLDLRADTTFSMDVIVDLSATEARLGSATLAISWPPELLTYLSHADAGNGVNASVNTGAADEGTLTLSFANVGGFADAVAVRRLVFRATPVIGRSGALSVLATQLSAATSFEDLLPVTTALSLPLRIR